MNNISMCPKCNTYNFEYLGFSRANVKHYRCLKRDCSHQEFVAVPSVEERIEDLTKRIEDLTKRVAYLEGTN